MHTVNKFFESPEAENISVGGMRQATSLLTRMLGMKDGTFVPEALADGMVHVDPLDSVRFANMNMNKPVVSGTTAKSTRDTRLEGASPTLPARRTPMTERKGLSVDGVPPDDDGASTEEMTSRTVSPYPTLPETKRILGEESRIHIYAVDQGGNQHDGGKYTTREIEFGGGAHVFVKNYIAPRFPSCEEFRLCVMDTKQGERLHGKVMVPKPKDAVASTMRETAETLRAEREQVLATEAQRAEREDKRYDRLLDSLQKVLGNQGGGTGGMAREMIAMQMARDIMADMRGRDSTGYMDTLIKRLEEMSDKRDKEVARGAREPSAMEQMMNVMATKRLMDEMFPPRRHRSFDGYDDLGGGPPPPMLPPLLPPTTNPVDDFDKMTTVIERIAPRQQSMSLQDMLALTEKMGGGGSQQLIVTMLQNQLQDSKRETDDLRREMREMQRTPQVSLVDQMKGFAGAMMEMTRLSQQMMGGGGSQHVAAMGTLEFLDSIADKIPPIVNSFVDARTRSEMMKQGQLPSGNGHEEHGHEEEHEEREPVPNDVKERQRRAFLRFAEMVEGAMVDDEYVNALMFLINNLKDDPKWLRTFKGVASLAVLRNRGQIHKVIEAILNQMYENNPPEGSVEHLVDALLKNADQFAAYIGVDPEKLKAKAREVAAKRRAAAQAAEGQGKPPAQPARPAQHPAAPSPTPPPPPVQPAAPPPAAPASPAEDEYPEPMEPGEPAHGEAEEEAEEEEGQGEPSGQDLMDAADAMDTDEDVLPIDQGEM